MRSEVVFASKAFRTQGALEYSRVLLNPSRTLLCISDKWFSRRMVVHLSAIVKQSREIFFSGDVEMSSFVVPGEIFCFRIAKGRIQAASNLTNVGSIVSFDMRIALSHVCKALVERLAVYSGALVKLLTVKLLHPEGDIGLRGQVFDDDADPCQEREQIKSVNRFQVR